MEQLDIAHAYGAERIAMIGQSQPDEFRFGRSGRAPLLPVLHRHLKRNLDGG